MTREEIEKLAKQIVNDVEGVNSYERSYGYVTEDLVALVRATLQEAARAVCPMCRERYEVGKDDGGLWVHDPFNGPEAVYSECKAPKIYDLIAALEEGS